MLRVPHCLVAQSPKIFFPLTMFYLVRTKNDMQILADGTCGCLGYDLSQGDDWKTIYNSMSFVSDYIGDFDDDTKRQVVAALCTGTVNDGDHLQVHIAALGFDPQASVACIRRKKGVTATIMAGCTAQSVPYFLL